MSENASTERIQRIHAEPGDTIVYTIARLITAHQAEQIHSTHRATFGENIGSVVVAGGVEISEVRPATSERTP